MTAYVRLFLEALHYMLRRRRVTELEANQVSDYSSGEILKMVIFVSWFVFNRSTWRSVQRWWQW